MFNFPGQGQMGGQMPSHSLALNPFALPPGMLLGPNTAVFAVLGLGFWERCLCMYV